VCDGDTEGKTKTGEEPPFVSLMARTMDPLKQTDDKAANSHNNDASKIDNRHFYVAIHTIVELRKGASRDEQVDPCIVESVGDEVGSWIKEGVLDDMGWKRWKMVLQRRQRAAEDKKTKIGHREIS
jgi:hypothetical protein